MSFKALSQSRCALCVQEPPYGERDFFSACCARAQLDCLLTSTFPYESASSENIARMESLCFFSIAEGAKVVDARRLSGLNFYPPISLAKLGKIQKQFLHHWGGHGFLFKLKTNTNSLSDGYLSLAYDSTQPASLERSRRFCCPRGTRGHQWHCHKEFAISAIYAGETYHLESLESGLLLLQLTKNLLQLLERYKAILP